MTLQEAKNLAMAGIKVTHTYFAEDEWMIMKGNIIQFEDGVNMWFDEFTEGKEYLKKGWSLFEEKINLKPYKNNR